MRFTKQKLRDIARAMRRIPAPRSQDRLLEALKRTLSEDEANGLSDADIRRINRELRKKPSDDDEGEEN